MAGPRRPASPSNSPSGIPSSTSRGHGGDRSSAGEGYHFKLDDFGTGYGGFAYLQRLGIRQIKIDKMFVDTIGTDDLKRSVLDATIAFGLKSGMEMIAEGSKPRSRWIICIATEST